MKWGQSEIVPGGGFKLSGLVPTMYRRGFMKGGPNVPLLPL